MTLNTSALWTRESALFDITSTVDGTTVKAKHGGSIRIPAGTKTHEALLGVGVADVVRDGFRSAFFVAAQRATSADKGTPDPVKCAALLKRMASFVSDSWESKEGTREKILFPILVTALLETVWEGADRTKVERKVGTWTDEARAALVNENDMVRSAYERLLGRPKSNIDTTAMLDSLDDEE